MQKFDTRIDENILKEISDLLKWTSDSQQMWYYYFYRKKAL